MRHFACRSQRSLILLKHNTPLNWDNTEQRTQNSYIINMSSNYSPSSRTDADHHQHHPHTHSTPIAGSKAQHHHTSTPPSSSKTSSLRGTKLARRARSFKDDLMERITQIRTPSGSGGYNAANNTSIASGGSQSTNNTLTRAQSPQTPRSRSHKSHHHHISAASSGVADMASSVASLLSGSAASPAKHAQQQQMSHARQPLAHQHDLAYHVHQVKFALKHFGDVVAKNKLEMLPGNGTVVLESVDTVLKMLNSMGLNEHSSVLISARTKVHVALGRLIKLCDEVLLLGDVSGGGEMPAEPCAALSAANVAEVAAQIVEALEQLVQLAGEHFSDQKGTAAKGAVSVTSGGGSANTLQRPSLENTAAGQRTSLPDIPLTP